MSKVLAFLKDDFRRHRDRIRLDRCWHFSRDHRYCEHDRLDPQYQFHKHLDAAEVAPSTALGPSDRRRACMQSV